MNNLIISPRQICKLATKSKIVGVILFDNFYINIIKLLFNILIGFISVI